MLMRGLRVSLAATEGTSRGGAGDTALVLGKNHYSHPELPDERR